MNGDKALGYLSSETNSGESDIQGRRRYNQCREQTPLSPLSNFMGGLISSKKVRIIEDNAKIKSPKRNFTLSKQGSRKGIERWAATFSSPTTTIITLSPSTVASGQPTELPLLVSPTGNPPLSLEYLTLHSPSPPPPCNETSNDAPDSDRREHSQPQRVRKSASAPKIPKRKQSADFLIHKPTEIPMRTPFV